MGIILFSWVKIARRYYFRLLTTSSVKARISFSGSGGRLPHGGPPRVSLDGEARILGPVGNEGWYQTQGATAASLG